VYSVLILPQMARLLFLLFSFLVSSSQMVAQDVTDLLKKVRAKMDFVHDYKATGNLKTDVSFLKIPVSKVNVYYKKPDQFRIKKDGGISLLPRGGISVNLNALMTTGEYVAVDAGEAEVNSLKLKVIKLLPVGEESDIILSTLYIDDQTLLIKKAVTTTRENGTYQMEMQYGKFAQWGLPDKVVVTFNTKDYKLPKGVTFEYEAGEKPVSKEEALKNKKGKVEITYQSYQINQGFSDAVFK
jgi:outer membrane lipoprotein-sorting protein